MRDGNSRDSHGAAREWIWHMNGSRDWWPVLISSTGLFEHNKDQIEKAPEKQLSGDSEEKNHGKASLFLKPHKFSWFVFQPVMPSHVGLFCSCCTRPTSFLMPWYQLNSCKFTEMCTSRVSGSSSSPQCVWQGESRVWLGGAPPISTEGSPWGTAAHSASSLHKPAGWEHSFYSVGQQSSLNIACPSQLGWPSANGSVLLNAVVSVFISSWNFSVWLQVIMVIESFTLWAVAPKDIDGALREGRLLIWIISTWGVCVRPSAFL